VKKTELSDRLAGLQIDLDPVVAAVHLGRIATELQAAPALPTLPGRARRRVATLLAGAAILVLPAAAAVAAEGSVPGDILFPVKQASEWVRSLVDSTVAADHRVDELETLLDRQASFEVISDQLRDAEAAVADVSAGDPVRDRLAAAQNRVERDYPAIDRNPSELQSPPVDDEQPPADATSTTTRPPDRPAAPATTGPGDEPTTTAPRGEPPSTTAPRDEPPPTTAPQSEPPPTTAPRDEPPPTTAPRDEPPPTTTQPSDRGGDGRGDNPPGDD
jgi:hypothetical protein